MAAVTAGFAAFAIAAPFAVIAPAYQPPALAQRAGEPLAVFAEQETPVLALLDAAVTTPSVQPGEYVQIATAWRAESAPGRDWSLFVHLVTPDNVIIAQRDIYPGGGLLAASDLEAGQAWDNPIAIAVPGTAPAPMTLSVQAGWYHLPTGERLALADGGETVALGEVALAPRASEYAVPNPVSVNFGGQMELIGYAVSDLSPAAGDSFEVTLYWRALQPMEADYVVFAHVIDPATTTIHAGSDAQPAGWTRPTSTWTMGEIVTDTHTLTLNTDAPPGIFELEIGVYLAQDGRFDRLRIVTPDGGMADDYTYLTRMRILPAPETTEIGP
jgi:hypothetical protein